MATAKTPDKLKDVGLTKLYRFDKARVRGSMFIILTLARRDGVDFALDGRRKGARTHEMQAFLYRLFRLGRGAAAYKPGGPGRHETKNISSNNHWKQAIDPRGAENLIAWGKKKGVPFHRPYDDEPWHLELRKRIDVRDLLRKRGLMAKKKPAREGAKR